MAYFVLGVATGAVFTSLLTALSSVFLTSGEAAGFTVGSPGLTGEATGEAAGDAIGLADDTGTGVATGLLGASGLVSQAPTTAAAAKTVDNINDLLIDFLLCARL